MPRTIVFPMEPLSAAEELPALYRALLDRVAQIESAGGRAAAYRLRTQATRIYSRSWDDGARRALRNLLDRPLESPATEPAESRESHRKRVHAT